jgi:hypothetical protein
MTDHSTDQPTPGVGEPIPAAKAVFGSVAELADAFGAEVCEPSVWPQHTEPPRYFLEWFEATGRRMYRIEVEDGSGSPINVLGFVGSRWQRADAGGWRTIPELTEYNGLGKQQGSHWHVVMDKGGLTVNLIGFGSRSEVIRAALSLRCVEAT